MIMDLTLFEQVLLWGFAISLVMGAVVSKTNFCTMGAVSDWINIADTGRLRAWLFSIAIAMLGVAALDSAAIVDMTLVDSGETGKPPYGTPQFVWLRYILGGILFGIGMTLGSGCGNKVLIRIGGGNLKSVIVFLAMGVGAYLMIYTDFGHIVFISWMPVIDMGSFGLVSQGVDEIIRRVADSESATWGYVTALLIGIFLLVVAFASVDFRSRFDNIFGGAAVGLAVIAAWYVTAGPLGRALLEELAFLDTVPYDAGAQSFTFVKPSGQFFYWMQEGFSLSILSFALVAGLGVIAGSFLYSALTGSLRLENFADTADFIRHLIGGLMMGIGGVLSLGCTFGQAITGASTLALGSFITFASIVFGAAFALKFQYYQMVYGNDTTVLKTLLTVFADFRLVPSSWRRLESI